MSLKRRETKISGVFLRVQLPLGTGNHIIVKFKDGTEKTFTFKHGDKKGFKDCWVTYIRDPSIYMISQQEVFDK